MGKPRASEIRQARDCLHGHLSALAGSLVIRWTTGCENIDIPTRSFGKTRPSSARSKRSV